MQNIQNLSTDSLVELDAYADNLRATGRYSDAAVERYAADLAARDARNESRARMTEVVSVAGLTGTRAQLCAYFGVNPETGLRF